MSDTEAVAWVRRNGEIDKDDLTDQDERVILSVAFLAGKGTGVAVDEERLAEEADMPILAMRESLERLGALGLISSLESTMGGRLRVTLPIPGVVTVIKSDDRK